MDRIPCIRLDGHAKHLASDKTSMIPRVNLTLDVPQWLPKFVIHAKQHLTIVKLTSAVSY